MRRANNSLRYSADFWHSLALGGHKQDQSTVRVLDELAVEQVGPNGQVERYFASGHLDQAEGLARQGSKCFAQVSDNCCCLDISLFVVEENIAVAGADDIVVENAGINGGGTMPGENGLLFGETVLPANRFGRPGASGGRGSMGPRRRLSASRPEPDQCDPGAPLLRYINACDFAAPSSANRSVRGNGS